MERVQFCAGIKERFPMQRCGGNYISSVRREIMWWGMRPTFAHTWSPITDSRLRSLSFLESDARTHRTPKALRAKIYCKRSPASPHGLGCGVGRGRGCALGVAVGVGVGVGVGPGGVGVGVTSDMKGATTPTVTGEPVLKKLMVAVLEIGAALESNRKLYSVP